MAPVVMQPLTLFSVFHLNLLFSSIPEEERPQVIKKCYWPLLELIRNTDAKIAIEATGYTLEEIHRLDPAWIVELRLLIKEGKTEFVGSGYAQIIGPLVPFEVSLHNLSIGTEVYESLLEHTPRIAYIHEHTYSAGLVALYKEAGYGAVIMEWNNAARAHPEWDPEVRYATANARGVEGETIPLLWNDSLAFQQFQRYAQGEQTLLEYLGSLSKHTGEFPRCMMLYGSDAEVFDFRPGRFSAEAVLAKESEWERIATLYAEIETRSDMQTVFPSEVLAQHPVSAPVLSLESPIQPIPVKKQEKYNLARWALTGRDSLTINTSCYRIHKALIESGSKDRGLWKRLCYAWDSDFRTHITSQRFDAYKVFLERLARDAGVVRVDDVCNIESQKGEVVPELFSFEIELPRIQARVSVRRGLSLESLIFSDVSKSSLLGTIPHGYFDHVPFNADFYSGNTVIDVPGIKRVTDLERATNVRIHREAELITVSGDIPLGNGVAKKRITFDSRAGTVTFTYTLSPKLDQPAVFHTGLLSFNPEAFDKNTLFYAVTNGGKKEELFSLHGVSEVRTDPVSLLVSSRTLLGNTTGTYRIGDKNHSVSVHTDMSALAALPLVSFTDTGRTYFLRSAYSLSEFDDTTRLNTGTPLLPREITFTIEAIKS